jgi:hypothetical protein
MRTITLAGGKILKIHDTLCDENVKFITSINNSDQIKKATEAFLKIPKGEGIVVFRARENYPCNETMLVEKIIRDNGCKDYFWNERPDIEASPLCTELIIIK